MRYLHGHISLFLLISFISLFIIKKLYKKSINDIKGYIFSYFFIYIVTLSFFILGDRSIYQFQDRYAMSSLPGYSLFITFLFVCLSIIFKGRRRILMLESNSQLYFEYPRNDPDAHFHLYDYFAMGFYDERATFAVLYGKRMEDLNYVALDYPTLLKSVKKNPGSLQKLHAFSYDGYNLEDITKRIQLSLTQDLSRE